MAWTGITAGRAPAPPRRPLTYGGNGTAAATTPRWLPSPAVAQVALPCVLGTETTVFPRLLLGPRWEGAGDVACPARVQTSNPSGSRGTRFKHIS